MRTLLVGWVLVCGCSSDQAPQADAAAATPIELTCTSYCSANMAACAGTNGQYDNMQNCLDTCFFGRWPAGTVGDTTGNTIACRANYTNTARTTPETACTLAGPTGGGQCGELCDNFCSLEKTLCSGVYDVSGPYDCANTCPSFATTGSYTAGEHQIAQTVQCRFYWLTVAASLREPACGNTYYEDVDSLCY